MEIGIDSFVARKSNEKQSRGQSDAKAIAEQLERIKLADEVGLDVFGIGEHHRHEFLDSATAVILGAAAAITKRIKLTSAVTVLSAADPVRVFEQFATLDLISNGRAEIVAGRGSFIEAFPLFGFDVADYDALYAEKLNLLLTINKNEKVTWSGKFRPALHDQGIYPRPFRNSLPIWMGVGGTPASFKRAGVLGLPLAVAVIGGQTHRFRSLVDLYRESYMAAGHDPSNMKVALHSLGYVGEHTPDTIEEYYPGYAEVFTTIGRERGWPPITRERFNGMIGPEGAIVIGDPANAAAKIIQHSQALGGISRFTFQMDNANLAQMQMMKSIELIGTRVIPIVKKFLGP
ncbi:LLM class flavin-dependent oxidoreductase [Chryseolinea soli]|uniref:LLM class flavin-dependent oxidoreductase n=1 Tax=Chryseolinea soli TaxID=2321403 RepID=A0A385SWD8_9BACT|nr:LLM class flavin-dependent oxidoreductase [Chryseolinea soli]AYB34866.1 LLM class flavin-dependent oxidoreductase [Chryseolinea soli]